MTYVVVVDTEVPAGRPYVTKAMPLSSASNTRSNLALMFLLNSPDTGNGIASLTHVGAVVRSSGQAVTTYERRMKIEELFAVIPAPIDSDELAAMLRSSELDALLAARGGIQFIADDVAKPIVAAICKLRPALHPIIDWLRSLEGFSELGFSDSEMLWREERDAANVALRIGGYSATPLRAWQRPDEDEPFIAGIVPYPRPASIDVSPERSTASPGEMPREQPTESESPWDEGQPSPQPDGRQGELDLGALMPVPTERAAIEHDARVFPGWQKQDDYRMHVHSFTQAGRLMQIINVDSTKIEAKTGADLIYYHVNTKSFVLVQYKRLTRKSLYVDSRLIRQLGRMERIAKLCKRPEHPDDWRIGPDFSFLKLADVRESQPDTLFPGLYLPSSYVRVLLEHSPTSYALGYENVHRYLSNTDFIDIVARGYVGTVGVTIKDLQQVVKELAADGDSVTVAIDNSQETTADRQKRLRSRKAPGSNIRPKPATRVRRIQR